ncbi:proline--tRNA ligase [Candidatus Roizmanbacteria bacterium]|nr:proline--tRNA ligase [Candidatus Roizmanbacteria bacterium]
MLYSRLFPKAKKTVGKYDSINAKYLQQAGFIDQTMTGVYTFLPLGLRVLNKIEQIIREEMNTIGQEVYMPSLSPKSIWEATGRLESFDALFKVVGANKPSISKNPAEYILNSTHEEILVPIAKKSIQSYKDFPYAIYQIQTKFRNEPRPKSGLLRTREFRMKDLYSFHTSEEDFQKYYEKSKEVYVKVFERLGLGKDTVIALASGGSFTEKFSHEFQTKCETGEDMLFYVKSKNVYYNREVAPSRAPSVRYDDKKMLPRKDVKGAGIIGVEELAEYLHIPVEKTTKTLLFETDKAGVIAAAVRGGYEVNEEKLRKVVDCKWLVLASEKTVKKVTGAEVGYAGILDLPAEVKVYMDESMKNRLNFETGANKTHYHTINVNFGRDIPDPKKFYDIKVAKDGDLFPETGEAYKLSKTSEIGNIFPLETRFTEAFDYRFIDKDGKSKPIIMGCYGIGSSRIMGVLVEKFHDDKGIIWPENVAPYQVHLIGLDLKSVGIKKRAYKVYQQLQNNHIEVLFDDREETTAGEKFADADLIGIPHRLVISKRTGDNVEYKHRAQKEMRLETVNSVLKKLSS